MIIIENFKTNVTPSTTKVGILRKKHYYI